MYSLSRRRSVYVQECKSVIMGHVPIIWFWMKFVIFLESETLYVNNSLWPSDAYIRQWITSVVFLVMAQCQAITWSNVDLLSDHENKLRWKQKQYFKCFLEKDVLEYVVPISLLLMLIASLHHQKPWHWVCEIVGNCLPQCRISTSCAIWLLRNDRKGKSGCHTFFRQFSTACAWKKSK